MTRTRLTVAVIVGALTLYFLGRGLVAWDRRDQEVQARIEARVQSEDAIAIDQCTKAGGFIIRSGWTSAIIDCKIVNPQR